jgi:hypothetical protein
VTSPDETDQAPASDEKKFVWRSTEASLLSGNISILATTEVLVAVVCYWFIILPAGSTVATLPLWAAVLFAPLALLRSRESVKLGVQWFENPSWFMDDLPEEWWYSRNVWIFLLAPTVLLVSLKYFLELLGVKGLSGTNPYIVALASLCVNLVIAVKRPPKIFMVGLSGFISGAAAGFLASVSIWVVITSSFLCVLLSLLTGWFLPIWIRAVTVRIGATLWNVWAGFLSLPDNFRKVLFSTDAFTKVELVPESELFAEDMLRDLTSEEKGSAYRISTALMLSLHFRIPVWFYRLSIKSTFWLYLPILYIVRQPVIANSPRWLLDRLFETPWEQVRRWLAGITVITTTAFLFWKLIEGDFSLPEVISFLEYFVLVDYSLIKPWHWLSIASSAITLLGLWLWAGHVRTDLNHTKEGTGHWRSIVARAVWLERLVRIRNVLSVLWIGLAIGHLITLRASGWVSSFLPSHWTKALREFYRLTS